MTRGGYQKIATDENTKKYGLMSLLLFQWMDAIFKTGSRGTVEESDFPPLSRENSTDTYTKRLQTQWEKEKEKSKGNGKRPKLWKSVIAMISLKEALIMVPTRALYGLWRLFKPFLLGYLLSSLMEPDPHKNLLSYSCVITMGLGAFIGTISDRHFTYSCDVLGIGVSSALKGLIYQKCYTTPPHSSSFRLALLFVKPGRLLAKGHFPELEEKGIFDSALDPLGMKPFRERESNARSVSKKEDNPEMKNRVMPALPQNKEIQMPDEDRMVGGVTFKLYWDYFRSRLSCISIIGLILLCFITQVVIVSPDFWLSSLTMKSQENQKDKANLIIFGFLVLGSFIFAAARAFCFLQASVRCSKRLHDKMAVAILEAPVFFFDSNPVGRVLNRFSKDTGCMDEVLPKAFLFAIQLVLAMLASILVLTVTNPWLLLVAVPMAIAVVYISRYQDVHTQSYIMVLACERWLSLRMCSLNSILTCAVALEAIFVSQNAAMAGIGLVYVLESMELMDYTVRKAAEVENFMTSVERGMTYTKLDHEPGYKVHELLPEHWPFKGDITFQDLSMTYYPGGPQVLRKLNLHIKGGTNVGVTGRTGAGKSSLVAALLRMPDAHGATMIDGIPIKDINLQVARRCISVLGQCPVLFSGSLRENLDLIEQFQDVELWRT
ncbi:Multidrug resistance-associated protein 4 [Stylophora pistillata]|uniref:Multidrug resistance-associated protein 4 n=1 Tax=Stylophora pistillata TaxID=50429 RepID=A0A2B4RR42_STYPI|nr:Multidrug resistance-associated protein 4 [Stylophora pistillata]